SPCPCPSRLVIFLFFLPPCSPGCTLFPYTTLFRSRVLKRMTRPRASATTRPSGRSSARRPESGPPAFSAPGTIPLDGYVCAPSTDRKSTRLNSSHVSISYAVFCLKKKKGQTLAQSR